MDASATVQTQARIDELLPHGFSLPEEKFVKDHLATKKDRPVAIEEIVFALTNTKEYRDRLRMLAESRPQK